jgi:RNA polymerase sigma-70 factor (ECF subfamily)
MIRQIFEDNYGWLKRFLRVRYFSLNDFDIEDLIQQAILKLLYSDNITGIRNLTAYVFTVLDNGARDHFRKRNRETLVSDHMEEGRETVESKILAQELNAVITKAIKTLEPKQRYVFVETQIKGRSYEELARETGEKTGTLLSRKSRAVKKLRMTVYAYINGGQRHEP